MGNYQPEMFEEERHVSIKDNSKLEGVCNHILSITEHKPEILIGEIGEIYRKLTYEFWMESGLQDIIPSEKWNEFRLWLMDEKRCTNVDTITRGLRYLVDMDMVRLSKSTILTGERHRERIRDSLRK